ncbi:hypothetical protein CRV08_11665 [Halarcobacter ebronensis]|uniref:Uncharacterized protein n=1 Tax=Halarcobacter ebronensis TaxID=1462615 RepID=A0A4Q0Y9R8_9BACT|nr:hypothetical protein [Halarcobacter ebronensis]RXJ66982.1 hypothetical protein CRV08_11665 [Halarcobacter ebronensis]
MPDLATIGVALSSLKTSMDIAKALKDSNISLSEAEQKLKVAELISSLADLKTELADVKISLIEKDEEIKNLKCKIEEKESLSFDGKFYWKEGDKTPFCAVCLENSEKLLHLKYYKANDWGSEHYVCMICKTTYSL